ncbi:hypothetical protein LCGC14_1215020 [marine sediment metagenome]|uniref:Uncharacterized protein n=1 Tax=marine sediment metagenome TaxID=412755 RepID=A0A0F9M0G3_9ZZZZ
MDIVEVEWEDSHTSHGWQDEPSLPASLTVRSVGYAQRNDKSGITLVESIVQANNPGLAKYGCTMAIPRSAIRKVTKLGPKRGK